MTSRLSPAPPVDDHLAPPPRRKVEIHVPFTTFLKLFLAILTAVVLYRLWPLLLLVLMAALIAATLFPFVVWLNRKGWSHGASLSVVIGGLLVLLGTFIALLVPAFIGQISSLTTNLPALRDSALHYFPAGSILQQDVNHLFENADWAEVGAWTGRFLSAGGVALNGMVEVLVMLVFTIYLLVDGDKIYRWVFAFFTPATRRKLHDTSSEVSKVIFSYVSGQMITSVLVFIYSYIVLTVLHVPAPLMLAVLAGVFDIFPILGIFLSTAPALMLALSVSPRTAFLTVLCYVLYHGVETYVIVPRVYGKSLRLSTFTVLLGLLAGALLAGIPGAIVALPALASYAVIERIWLSPYLGEGVSEKHELLRDKEFGEKT